MAQKFSLFAPFLWALQQTGRVRLTGLVVSGTDVPYAAGPGLEIEADASKSTQRSFNRGPDTYLAAIFDAAFHWFQVAGTTRLIVDAQGATAAGSFKPASYTVAGVPSASTHGAGAIIYVSNETGGAVPAFSDGTNWRRMTDRNIIA